ncbi:unnamed protein product [Amoebophrya sp. A25]|nr:unnamed protein product [Amoebophrya sp. A25]|eukprot:GSA25T00024222001.1
MTSFESRWFGSLAGMAVCLGLLLVGVATKSLALTLSAMLASTFFGSIFLNLIFSIGATIDSGPVQVAISTGQGLSGIAGGIISFIPLSRPLLFIYIALVLCVLLFTARLYRAMRPTGVKRSKSMLGRVIGDQFDDGRKFFGERGYRNPDAIEGSTRDIEGVDAAPPLQDEESKLQDHHDKGVMKEQDDFSPQRPFREIWRDIRGMVITVTLTYAITFVCFPGMLVGLFDVSTGGNQDFLGQLIIGAFQIGDVCGRKSPDFLWKRNEVVGLSPRGREIAGERRRRQREKISCVLGALRLAFIPMLLLASHHTRSVPTAVKFVLSFLFAASHGFLATATFVLSAASLQSTREKAVLGLIMNLVVTLAILLGGILGFVLISAFK